MTPKIAIVGSKSLEGLELVYEMIDGLIMNDLTQIGQFTLINGGEEGVDTMAAEVALSRGIDCETIPLKVCPYGCNPAGAYCFAHSYEPRSREIADGSLVIYRIYDVECSTSTCEVTARIGEELGKKVHRIPVEILKTT